MNEQNEKPVKKKRLRIKERAFVHEIMKGGTQAAAIVAAGYKPKNRINAAVMGSDMMRKSHIQSEIKYLFQQMYPESDNVLLERIREVMALPIVFSQGEEGITIRELKEFIELQMKAKGYMAPLVSKSLSVTAKVKKLPEE